MKIARFFAIIAVAAAALPFGMAFAQYAEPLGVCTVVPTSGSVQPNSVASFTVSTRTAAGNAAPGVSGTVAVASGSGTVLTPTFTTAGDGTATISVQTGANPGDLTLNVTCGALQTSGVVRVAQPSVLPKPPDTGEGLTTNDQSLPLLWMLAGITLVGVAGAASLATVTARRK